jgi:Spy/CpxP family protein refolding chaperone
MKRFASVVLSVMLAAVVAMPLLADDEAKKPKRKPKKRPDPAVSILARLEKAELTDEQVAKVKELATKLAEVAKPPKVTPEQRKAMAEAMKKAKVEGMTREEMQKLRESVLKLTDEQKAAMKKAQEARAAVMKEIMAMLTPEQKKNLGMNARGKKTGERKPRGKKKPKQEE